MGQNITVCDHFAYSTRGFALKSLISYFVGNLVPVFPLDISTY